MNALRAIFSNKLVRAVALFTFATVLAVVFNIPVLRQLFSFIFLGLLPGFLILTSLNLRKLGWTEKLVLSVGISVSFVMLFGLIVNFTTPVFGYKTSLSLPSILISFALAMIGLAIPAARGDRGESITLPRISFTVSEKALLVIPALFPLLSLTGMRLMNQSGNNILLMILLLLIPIYVIFVAVVQNKVSERLYPAFIFLIGISVLLMMGFRGNHVIGSDIHEAYRFFSTVLNSQYWSVTQPSLIESLLSISLLPAVYQSLMNLPQEMLYKVLFSVLFSVTPLAVFIIARKYIGSFGAFLASFLFMSQVIFLWTPGVAQTNMAIFFFSLSVMVHFHSGIGEFARKLLFLIFIISSVVSHYSTSYIFFFLVTIMWLGAAGLSAFHTRSHFGFGAKDSKSAASQESSSAQVNIKRGITVTVILLFFVFIFLWHAQITRYAFDSAVSMIYRTLSSMHQSFLVESKGSSVTGAFGQTALPTVPQQIRFITYWLEVIFIAVGGVAIFLRYKKAVSYPGCGDDKLDLLKTRFESEYFVLSAACGIALTAAVVMPYVSVYYSMERAYFQMMVVLAPFFVICGILIGRLIKVKPYLILSPVLALFFLSVTGASYNLFGLPASLLTNNAGIEYEHFYVQDRESYAARWLVEKKVSGVIRTDYDLGPRIIASQAGISTAGTHGALIPDYHNGKDIEGYLYLFYPSVVKGEEELSIYAHMTISEARGLLSARDKVYSAGLTEIYWTQK